MTTVNVTKDMITEVSNLIKGLSEAEIGKTTVGLHNKIKDDKDIGALMTTALWDASDVRDLRERLENYNTGHVYAYLHIPYTAESGSMRVSKIYRQFDRPCVVNTEVVHLTAEAHPLIKEYIDALIIKNEAVARWDGVKLQITSFLESCKTLNKALKLWPDVQRYIPKQYITRVNAVTEKAASSQSMALEALKNINMDAVTASTVLARMAGATI